MPAPSTRRPPSRAGNNAHKKARIAAPEKTKLSRKGTPPPKLKPKSKPESRAASLAEKPKSVPKVMPVDFKGKGKAISISVAENDATVDDASLPSSFKIIVGTYEKLLYGLQGTVSVEDGSPKFSLKPIFIFPAHISCIKTVAASPHGGKWLATGSADEIVKVWDLRRRKEIGGLMHHEGSITHLEFPSRSHLLSASEDGTLCLFRARDWSVLRSLKGHKGRVNSVAVHPSGKVGLSVGKDRTLRMWDLMRGRGSASTKLGKEAELVRWSVDGSIFIVQTMSTLDVYSTDMEKIHTIQHPSRIHDVKFCKAVEGEELMLVAAEDKKVSVYEVPSDREKAPFIIAEMVGHENRVKAVETLKIALPPLPNDQRKWTQIVSTASSDGKVRLYDLAALPLSPQPETPQLSAIAEYDTKGSRLTCLALADGDVVTANTSSKRKREDEDDEVASEAEDEASGELPEGSGDEDEEEEEGEGELEDEAEDE